MSASLVRKSLALVDDTYQIPADKKKKHAFDPRQRHQLVTGEVKRKGRKEIRPLNIHTSQREKVDTRLSYEYLTTDGKPTVESSWFSLLANAVKVQLLKDAKKLTVGEARRNYRSREKIAEEIREKFRVLRETSAVDLDEKITSQLFERAVTKRPVKLREGKKDTSTAFTEEDFKKFEEEYFDEDL